MKTMLLAAMSASAAFAQLSMPLQKGVAAATCFSGWKSQSGGAFTIDLDGHVVGLVDVRDRTKGTNPGTGTNWQPDMFHNGNAPPAHQWTARRLGQVFGLAIDKEGNIFVAASRAYGAQGSVGETGAGLWGSAGPGGIYKLNGQTGEVSDFILTRNAAVYTSSGGNANRMPNTGPGLGNLAYDRAHDQLLVTNFEDGKIYRIGSLNMTAGTIVGTPYDPFDADDGSTGFADPGLLPGNGAQIGERLWGIGVFNGRAYFSVWNEDGMRAGRNLMNAVHSVAINGSGALVGTTIRPEIDMAPLTGLNWSNPVSDIEFSSGGKMLLAERGQLIGSPEGLQDLFIPAPLRNASAHRARVFEYYLTGSTNSLYAPLINPLWVGEVAYTNNERNNSAGGIDYGYQDYDSETGQLTGCEKMIWATGDYLRVVGNNAFIYGLQGTVYGVNTPGTNDDHFVDLNGQLNGYVDKTQIGDVDIFRDPCGPEGVAGVTGGYLECVNEGTGQYNFVISVSNNQSTDAYGAVVLLPNGTSTALTLTPPLAPGATTTVTIPVTLGYQTAGSVLNFVFQFHGKPLPPPLTYEWCDRPVTVPVKVPECGCLSATLVRTNPSGTGFALIIKNHVVDPASTFLTIDSKTAGVSVTPGSANITIPYGGTVVVPLTLTPPPAAGSAIQLVLTLHGKKLGNGFYENCCMEEARYVIPQLVIAPGATGLTGRVFEDLNHNLRLDERERPLGGVNVTFRPREGAAVSTRTNEGGEYFLSIPGGAAAGSYTLAVEPPAGLSLPRPATANLRISGLQALNFPMVRTRPAGEAVSPATAEPVPVELERADGLGGESSSAIRYSVPEGMATLRLLDANGNQAAVLHDGFHVAGSHVLAVREHNLTEGFYTLELSAQDEVRRQIVYVSPMKPEGARNPENPAGVQFFTRQVKE